MIKGSFFDNPTAGEIGGTLFCLALGAIAHTCSPAAVDPTHDLSPTVAKLIGAEKPLIGHRDAPITVISFVDFDCPSCRTHFQKVEQAVASKQNQAFYIEQMPMPMHKLAEPAAVLALESQSKGNFRPVHDALFAGAQLTTQSLDQIAKKYGLSPTPSAQITQELKREQTAFKNLSLSFVPVFVVSDGVTARAYGWREALRKLAESPN